MKDRASYTPEDKLDIVLAVFSKKTTIQKVAKEKGIAPTLISLWKKQAEDAMMARFQPQPKGRRKSKPEGAPVTPESSSLKNDARKAKIKAAHLEASLKETKARCARLEEQVGALVTTLGCRMVKVRTPRKGSKD
ncbi:MAG: transposase [Akkermansia sp.]|nr:transposase [Akkermansia sp.]